MKAGGTPFNSGDLVQIIYRVFLQRDLLCSDLNGKYQSGKNLCFPTIYVQDFYKYRVLFLSVFSQKYLINELRSIIPFFCSKLVFFVKNCHFVCLILCRQFRVKIEIGNSCHIDIRILDICCGLSSTLYRGLQRAAIAMICTWGALRFNF